MRITSAYKSMKGSIVAFVANSVPVSCLDGPPPPFPPIIGTGFVVHEDGVIATNAHVVDEFRRVPLPPDAPPNTWPVSCVMLRPQGLNMVGIRLEIIGAMSIRQVIPEGVPYYGPPNGPDLAFIHVKAKKLTPVKLAGIDSIEEGTEVATAGFPMGIDALMAPGWIHQMTPMLQRGIVSAVLPFPGPTPHAYAVNIMVQGGASGSPVFLTDSGAVIGVLYAGLNESGFAQSQGQNLPSTIRYTMPTNISYVVPSHYVFTALEQLSRFPELAAQRADAKTIDELLENAGEPGTGSMHGAQWVLREVE